MSDIKELLKAKIPCPETGITVKKSLCDICSPQMHCGVCAYVKDGKIIKVEGNPDHPRNKGLLCTKGQANRAYVYRNDRIFTPLARVGARGEGRFEPISWEEAYERIGRELNRAKAQYGPESVAFFSGYSKWYRPFLRRFANAFGSPNYGTESSCCYTSGAMAWQIATGLVTGIDLPNTGLFVGWAFSGYYSVYLLPRIITNLKKKGMKVVVIDPKYSTAAQRLADLHLRPKLGTDGALALAAANILIERGWTDTDYIEKYVHGFEEYKAYAAGFNESNIESITGVPYEQVVRFAEMLHQAESFTINESAAPLAHHRNGMQNYRAIMSLLAITGNYDKRGGQTPANYTYCHVCSGFDTREEEFEHGPSMSQVPPVGAERFPLWAHMEHEMQSNDMVRQINDEKPYPIKAVFALGMNHKMFMGGKRTLEALKKLDFFVDTDLFMTEAAKYADIVLPACSSLERGEFKTYAGGFAYYTNPVIEPLGQSKPDTDILCELARSMKLGDKLLESGYENCIRYMIQDLHITVEELKASPDPLKVPDFAPRQPRSSVEAGLPTKTGKFELYSEMIAGHPEWGLDPLPTYAPPYDEAQKAEYPLVLCAGARIPNALHSRLHDVAWLRSLRPEPMADIGLGDARALGVTLGDAIAIVTPFGRISVKACPTATVPDGQVHMYHGYTEADVNSILDPDNLDPYSGFPVYRSALCRLEKEAK